MAPGRRFNSSSSAHATIDPASADGNNTVPIADPDSEDKLRDTSRNDESGSRPRSPRMMRKGFFQDFKSVFGGNYRI